MLTLIILYLICVWAFVSVIAYSFYSTTKMNHYKFRYWYAIGILNIFHLVLALYAVNSGDYSWNEIRWMTFSLISLLLFEIFIHQTNKRSLELHIRTTFYLLWIVSSFFWSLAVDLTITAIFIWLCIKSPHYVHRKYFTWAFILYGLVYLLPHIVPTTTLLPMVVGAVYSTLMGYGVYKLYTHDEKEDMKEILKREILKNEDRKRT
jgi:hypothetical protein